MLWEAFFYITTATSFTSSCRNACLQLDGNRNLLPDIRWWWWWWWWLWSR